MKELRIAAIILERLSHNQDALRAAIEEVAKWVGERGAIDVVENVQSSLDVLDENIDAIRNGIADLVANSVKPE